MQTLLFTNAIVWLIHVSMLQFSTLRVLGLVKLFHLIDCRWEVMAYFHSIPQSSTSKDSELWIPTDSKQWQKPPLIKPIKSMSSEPLSVQLYVEHPNASESKS